MLPRLAEIEKDLILRRKRAEEEQWLGETEGIDLTLSFVRAKQANAARLRNGRPSPSIDYVLAVRADVTAHPFEAKSETPDRNGPVGCWPQPRHRDRAPSPAALAAALPQEAFTSLTWRQGLRGELRSRWGRPAPPTRRSRRRYVYIR
ncbi:MAG: transposase [Streptomyces sp.]|jgi:hypothetical protein|nr:transposase [Streptomyces sp.]